VRFILNRYKNISNLNKTIIIRIVLISSIITAIITAFSFFNDYKTEVSELERTLTQIENSSIKSLEQSLWEINTNQLNIQLDGLLTIPHIYAIYHIDKYNSKGIEKKKRGKEPNFLFEKKVPVNYIFENSTVDLGHIVIVAYKDNIYNNLMSRALYVFITQTLKTMIVTIAMYFVFASYISNHITSITRYFSRINLESDLSFPTLKINKIHKDENEIDLLVHSINDMISLVAKANQENRAIIATQEKRIEEQEENAINSARLAALGEMAAGIAHEINNPASIISLSTRSLKKETSRDEPNITKVQDKINKIESSIVRINNIISSVKSFSRQSEADPFQEIDIVEIIYNSLNFCRERYKSERLDLIIDIPSLMLPVSVRQSEVSQVILNLVNNAYDAISEEEDEERWIKIHLKCSTEEINLEISDSGPGIPEELRTKIFDPFFTTKDVGKGTGIGLSLSKKLMENNNGTLQLDSTCENTKFILTLPLIKT